MRFKILIPGHEDLFIEFLQWLTPEALDLWFHYGKTFDQQKVKEILADSSELKIAGIDIVDEDVSKDYSKAPSRERMIILGHLYNFTEDSCRLGIVSGITGKGYGTQMMKVLINFAKASRVKKVYLSTYQDNYPALALYRKFGFQIIQEFSDRPRHAYEMELTL